MVFSCAELAWLGVEADSVLLALFPFLMQGTVVCVHQVSVYS